MSAKRPDFTDVFNADAMMRHHAKRGMKLVEKGGLKKDAQHELRQAIRWEKEKARLEKLVRGRGPASRARARKKLPRRKASS